MLTREEIEKIDRECSEEHITQTEYLKRRGIARHQYYRWKRRYKDEDANLRKAHVAANRLIHTK